MDRVINKDHLRGRQTARREREREMDEEDRILERERLQMEQIRELDFEELQVEEVDEFRDSEEDDDLGISHHTRLRLLS